MFYANIFVKVYTLDTFWLRMLVILLISNVVYIEFKIEKKDFVSAEAKLLKS